MLASVMSTAATAAPTWIQDYESGLTEPFNQRPGLSGTSIGIEKGTFDVIEAADGEASFHITWDGFSTETSAGWVWQVRLLPNPTGVASAANPVFSSDGYVGYYLKVPPPGGEGDAFMLTAPVLENGATANATAGRMLSVIADGQWHLYEWNMDNPAHFPNTYSDVFGPGQSGPLGDTTLEPMVSFDSIALVSFTKGGAGVSIDQIGYNNSGPLSVFGDTNIGFTGAYEPAAWETNMNGHGGTIDTSNAPNSITITGPDDGSNEFGGVEYYTIAEASGEFSFDWEFENLDQVGPFDAGYYVNDIYIPLSDGMLDSGTVSFTVHPGDFIGWAVFSDFSSNGPGVLTISNFSAPVPSFADGDYNRDNVVDAADYVLWRKLEGANGITAYSSADGSGDGRIRADDYNFWHHRFGDLFLTDGAVPNVPEPPMTALVCLGLASVLLRRKLRLAHNRKW
jgi:hypothetical protein